VPDILSLQDCNWGDHCGKVTRELGVVSWRTPQGLQWTDFQQALEKYHHQQNKKHQHQHQHQHAAQQQHDQKE
jgi:hypothetical protein